MKCEKCGKEFDRILIDIFDHNGCDSANSIYYAECEENAVVIETDNAWVGYGLSEEERPDTIACPHCKKFPFKHKEIQVCEIVRVVCFKSEESEHAEKYQQERANERHEEY